ncbi:hypothetical protein ICM05_09755 [Leucobacter sp. cx-42]|uniref:hypothetical protein n=1 Tax=unclassified Leucobacter TaxID=2621730 RepID=UPI00165DB7B3|nr:MULTISPECIES: hypothetical protein [unclassified Leucobacter]MBC9954922.1 hypothetical protein [Leucobacter sp. cx-42]
MSESWEFTRTVRERHVTGPATDQMIITVGRELNAWREGRDTEPPRHCWRTAQVVDGRIVGQWAETNLEAQVGIEVWWGSAVHWIVPDPESVIHDRYLTNVSTGATRSDEARTFALTDQPVDNPQRPTVTDLVADWDDVFKDIP